MIFSMIKKHSKRLLLICRTNTRWINKEKKDEIASTSLFKIGVERAFVCTSWNALYINWLYSVKSHRNNLNSKYIENILSTISFAHPTNLRIFARVCLLASLRHFGTTASKCESNAFAPFSCSWLFFFLLPFAWFAHVREKLEGRKTTVYSGEGGWFLSHFSLPFSARANEREEAERESKSWQRWRLFHLMRIGFRDAWNRFGSHESPRQSE